MTLPNHPSHPKPQRPATPASSHLGVALAALFDGAGIDACSCEREIKKALHHARRRTDELLALQKAQMHRLRRKGQSPPRALLLGMLRRWDEHRLSLQARLQARLRLTGLLLPPGHHVVLQLEHELRLQQLQNWLRERLIEALVVYASSPPTAGSTSSSVAASIGAAPKYTRRRLPAAAKQVLANWFNAHLDFPYVSFCCVLRTLHCGAACFSIQLTCSVCHHLPLLSDRPVTPMTTRKESSPPRVRSASTR